MGKIQSKSVKIETTELKDGDIYIAEDKKMYRIKLVPIWSPEEIAEAKREGEKLSKELRVNLKNKEVKE